MQQSRFDPSLGPYDFDRFVAPTYRVGIEEQDEDGRKTGRMVDKVENGFNPICFQAWVGTSHSITLMLYKRTVKGWDERLRSYQTTHSYSAYKTVQAKKTIEKIGENSWTVYRTGLLPRVINTAAGPFELWIHQIGDSDYTIALELGANQDSLQYPETHTRFQDMFRYLLKSVKIEPL